MMKKLISLLLAFAILLTVLPTAVLASDPTLEPEESAVVDPIPGTNITEEELENVLVGLFDAMELPDSTGNDADAAVNYAYTERTASQDLINFIRVHENAVMDYYQPMWDYQQWSIGFGSACPVQPKVNRGDNWDNGDWEKYTEEDFNSPEEYEQFASYIDPGMSLEEATELLENMVNNDFSPAVNRIARKYNITLTQQQFDALVGFSYALGTSWTYHSTYGYRIGTALVDAYHGKTWTNENSLSNPGWFFINALGTWCHLENKFHHAIATRRVQELEIFKNGVYYTDYNQLRKQYQNGTVSKNGHITYLNFDANGGKIVQPAETDWSSTNRFYFTGSPYGSLLSASKSGYYFAGWYTEKNGGTKITADTVAQLNTGSSYYAGITVYAHWSTDPNVDPEIGSPNGNPGGGNNGSGNTGGTNSNPGSTNTGFTDVKVNDWYAANVQRAVELGLMNGVGGGKFNPTGTLTRGMVATMLHRMAGTPAPTSANPFKDVPSGQYYTDAVRWAVEKGITTGASATTFQPNAFITRQDLATFLYRYARLQGESLNYSAPAGYTDFDRISGYAIPAVCWAWTNGLINGKTATTLAPRDNCTRAEAATIFVRYMDKFE